MAALDEYPIVLRCDGLRARPSQVQLIADGVWRVDWIGGLVSVYRGDPRGDLKLGYDPKHLRWWRPAPEHDRTQRVPLQLQAELCPWETRSQRFPLRLVSASPEVSAGVTTTDAGRRDFDAELEIVVVLGSGVDCVAGFSALGPGPDTGVIVDDDARVLHVTAPAWARSTQPGTNVTPVGDASGPRHEAAAIERMADATMRLARRNETLEDFAALVAHELKSPLEAALLADEPHRWIVAALDLVESLLQAATESPDGGWASLSDCVAAAACCLDPIQFTVAGDEDVRFPLPPTSLSVILRNLLANAAAAQARRVDVFTTHHGGEWSLVVDDDGVGLDVHDNDYERGSGIGLELCRRIAGRNGGRLELVPRGTGGTRAILTMERAA